VVVVAPVVIGCGPTLADIDAEGCIDFDGEGDTAIDGDIAGDADDDTAELFCIGGSTAGVEASGDTDIVDFDALTVVDCAMVYPRAKIKHDK